MILGLVSDTHMPHFGDRLPPALESGLRSAKVERILHCGDMTALLIVPLFEALAPFEGVAGNNDGDEIRARFGRRKILDFDGVRIGMVHGDGPQRGSTPDRAFAAFAEASVDAVVYGHSHVPKIERRGQVWLINPGSPTDKRAQPRFSYATLAIQHGRLEPELHFYDNRR